MQGLKSHVLRFLHMEQKADRAVIVAGGIGERLGCLMASSLFLSAVFRESWSITCV